MDMRERTRADITNQADILIRDRPADTAEALSFAQLISRPETGSQKPIVEYASCGRLPADF
ncbi:hypothetical protein ABTE52_21975, partial [Acinetobacter baumannii]